MALLHDIDREHERFARYDELFVQPDSPRFTRCVELLGAAGLLEQEYAVCLGLGNDHDRNRSEVWKHFLRHCGTEIRYFRIDLVPDGLRDLVQFLDDPNVSGACLSSMIGSYVADERMWNPATTLPAAGWKTVGEACRLAGTPIVVIGDSHSSIYRRPVMQGDAAVIPIHLQCVGGSAKGAGNGNSRSGHHHKMKHFADVVVPALGRDVPVFLKFGQVDTEFVYTFQRVRDGARAYDAEDFRRFCSRVVDSYLGFVSQAFARHDVRVVSILPPALSDEAWRAGYVNAFIVGLESSQSAEEVSAGIQSIDIPTQRERTLQHALFNTMLADACRKHGLAFVDDFHPFLSNGVLGKQYTAMNGGADHHIEFVPAEGVAKAIMLQEVRRGRQPVTGGPAPGGVAAALRKIGALLAG